MTGNLITCYNALSPSNLKDFALVVIFNRLVPRCCGDCSQ